MVPRFSTLSSLPCESCQLRKHTRVSFPKRLNNRANLLLSLSTLMFGVLVGLLTMPGNIFQPHLLRLCLIMGFFINLLVLITPQQNGVAKCKDRHLVETARTLLLHSNDKLSAKAMKCLFLGYSRLQKGYHCYSLETHRYFISADVTFFEDSPFFSTTSESLPVSEVLPLPIVSPADVVPPRPLQVYHRRPRVAAPLPFAEAPADSLPIPSASPAPALPSPNDLPIACSERTRSTPTHEALSHPGWRQAMVDEMAALHSKWHLDLVVLPSGKSIVGCRWVYAVKVDPDGQVNRLKDRLVAKGYTQVYGSNYGDTFSPVAKIASVRLLLSMAAMCSWPLIRGVWFSVQVTSFSIWLETISSSMVWPFLALLFKSLACFAVQQTIQFSIIITPWGSVFIWLFMWTTSSLQVVIRMLNPVPVWSFPKGRQREPLGDPGRYRRLVGKLNYLTITHPDISFPHTRPKVVLYENRGHTQVVGYTDADWAGSPTDRRSTSGYCVFIGGNLISWKSKKQDVVARSSAEAMYRAMALTTCELIWLRHLLQELRFGKDEQMKLICDNQAALHIASNPVFHERTKHIKVDCHFIREKIASRCVATSFVNSNDQLADIFTKSLRGPRIKYICNKLGAYDIYAPA
ncbi:Retrovirus-related Pol polyprotein from transposon RE1 [Vitis vinifera]|uniref:Retrovirus-related Pol polyprotein from transposon RE1 n=1 Tax=Vitis vinifera TaxID=29760 RepID=A0A438BX18_VITVI|nr:Retrovirus-related Pol polyprotein from transposon RE1 [Vitis vinifera]